MVISIAQLKSYFSVLSSMKRLVSNTGGSNVSLMNEYLMSPFANLQIRSIFAFAPIECHQRVDAIEI